ncbi:FAD-dependent tricarballylate dehydrogenase TcuA [Alicyclobacillus mengziensis]|uniref:FAD-dependent tricarballylate dehydrogenase TcuA n=1 Tax=Alicyclobacillus mengziensis TaxID=2931921 RepID=A0A9X7VXG6_9BACL|nr:FAD-dependent tricarballylate dehydrogenase TcuA [Alicyclobacillus mengziensis]QSO45548.1 FAD-dependent tricarballylate dehydrogenase TcuA [Alicyclobacillus mengziensis]
MALRTLQQEYDVMVVGGGNAALSAALSAREHGARVLIVERAPKFYRGGNSRHTRDFRIMHERANDYMMGTYAEDEFVDDLARVAGGEMNQHLARIIVSKSAELPEWLSNQGIRWQAPLSGTLHLARTNMFMLGGGRAMMNAYYQTAKENGVDVWYDSFVEDLVIDADEFKAARVRRGEDLLTVRALSVVLASGGFEANVDWLKRYWGPAADNFVIRGTPYNQGNMIETMLRYGAESIGEPDAFHAVAVDGRAPRFDGGIVTRLDSVPFGIVVNQDGFRFYDEGEDFWPKRYAIWGGLIARQPEQVAYSIIDSKAMGKFMPSVFDPVVADTLADLADKLGLDPAQVIETVETFNCAVRAGTFNPGELDDCHTEGLIPPKSHWAVPINTAPFYAYPLRTGITFTYLGVRVSERAKIQLKDGREAANMFAAGEMAAGNVLRRGYLAGFGLTMGAVLGRIAGEEAANVTR